MNEITDTGSSNQPPPRAIIFDWDNTLVDTWPTIHDAMNHTLVHFHMEPWTLTETRARVRQSMRDRFPTLFGDAWHKAADIFYDRYREIHIERLAPLPGAREMLECLHAKGVFMAIVSNKTGEYLRLEAAHLGWDTFLKNLVGAGDATRDKPAVDPVHLALQGSGTSPDQSVWFVGDADIDLECAINAGCVPVLLRENTPEIGEFDNFPPNFYVKNCNQFNELISKLSS
jgi:phosphoglycolate phosphatase